MPAANQYTVLSLSTLVVTGKIGLAHGSVCSLWIALASTEKLTVGTGSISGCHFLSSGPLGLVASAACLWYTCPARRDTAGLTVCIVLQFRDSLGQASAKEGKLVQKAQRYLKGRVLRVAASKREPVFKLLPTDGDEDGDGHR